MTRCLTLVERARKPARPLGRVAALTALGAMLVVPSVTQAQGPEDFADLSEQLVPSVVNISTSQQVQQIGGGAPVPQFPPGSPFEEFFRDFFDRRGEGQPNTQPDAPPSPRTTSLGSAFEIT